MPPPVPASLRLRLKDLADTRALLAGMSDDDPFVNACLARYLIIRSTGCLEAVRDDVADLYSTRLASENIARRVRKHLRTGLGVSPNQLIEFVRSFDTEWGRELEIKLDNEDQELRRSLSALVSARRKIAHGDGESVSAARALRWADVSRDLCAWLIQRFDTVQASGFVPV